MYARLYWTVSQREYQNAIFVQSLATWKDMRDGFEDLLLRYPDAWNMNNYGYFACVAKDKEKLKELLSKIGTTIFAEAWPVAKGYGPMATYEWCRRLVASP
jgi:hypothetical protein